VAGDTEVAEEEARVLAFQRTMAKDEPRPWETSPEIERLPLSW
jgi:hypothetical protein